MHIRSRHVTQICSDLAPSCPSCCSLQRAARSSRRHFTAALHKRRKGLPLPLLGFSVLESLFRSLPLVSCLPGEMPPHLLNVLPIPLRQSGCSKVSHVPPAEVPNPTLSPSARRDPSMVQCLRCGEKGLGSPQAVSKHSSPYSHEHTRSTHKISQIHTCINCRGGTVQYSSIKNIRFQVPKLWSRTCISLRYQGHPVASTIHHR